VREPAVARPQQDIPLVRHAEPVEQIEHNREGDREGLEVIESCKRGVQVEEVRHERDDDSQQNPGRPSLELGWLDHEGTPFRPLSKTFQQAFEEQ
jgi:hypothetical protein